MELLSHIICQAERKSRLLFAIALSLSYTMYRNIIMPKSAHNFPSPRTFSQVLALCWGRGPLQSLLSPSPPRQQPSSLSFLLFASVFALPLVFKGIGQDGKKNAKEGEANQSGNARSAKILQVGPSGGVRLVHRSTIRGGTSKPDKSGHLAQSEVKEDENQVISGQSGIHRPDRVGVPERATWQSLSVQSLASLFVFLLCVYLQDFRPWLPHAVVTASYCLLLYTSMLYIFNAAAAGMEGLGGVEVCEHFRRPYLASSLQVTNQFKGPRVE